MELIVEQIVLTPAELLLLKELRKNGVFNIQFGKCTLNFANNQLQNIIKEEIVYRKT